MDYIQTTGHKVDAVPVNLGRQSSTSSNVWRSQVGWENIFPSICSPINICAPMSWHVAVSGRRLGKETSWTWTLDRPTALTTYSQSWSCWWDYSGSEGFTVFPGQSSSVIDHRLFDLVASIQTTIRTETSVTSTSINLLLLFPKVWTRHGFRSKMTTFTRIAEGEAFSIDVDVSRRLSKIGKCSIDVKKPLDNC